MGNKTKREKIKNKGKDTPNQSRETEDKYSAGNTMKVQRMADQSGEIKERKQCAKCRALQQVIIFLVNLKDEEEGNVLKEEEEEEEKKVEEEEERCRLKKMEV